MSKKRSIGNIKPDEMREEMVQRLYRRFLWLDAKVGLYEGEEERALKFIDQMNKTVAGIIRLFEMKGVEASEEDLAKLLEKLPGKESKKRFKVLVFPVA